MGIMKKAIQFGAGNIGRGFLGQIFSQSGYEVVFVDIDKTVVSSLNESRAYLIKIVSNNSSSEVRIKNVRAVDAADRKKVVDEIITADIMATAVGQSSLKIIAPAIAQGFEERIRRGVKKPLNIIICENLLHAASILKGYILENLKDTYKDNLESHVGLVESVVSRMVPVLPDEIKKKNPLLIIAEEYASLPVDKKGFVGDIPQIKGLRPYDNLAAYQERKLFTHNTGHSICAYLGHLEEYKYIYEAIEDSQIKNMMLKALEESGQALIKKHNFDVQEHDNYIKDLLERFDNIALGDTVARGSRDPIRKLGLEDRLVGAARLALEFGIRPDYLSLGIAAALNYDNPQDKQAVKLAQIKEEKGIDAILTEICNLDPEQELSLLIKEKLKQLKSIRNRK